MWILINDNLINIFNIKGIEINRSKYNPYSPVARKINNEMINENISSFLYITILFKDLSEPIFIRKNTLEEAEIGRDLILIECNSMTSMLPKLALTTESNIRVNTTIEGYETTQTLGEKHNNIS